MEYFAASCAVAAQFIFVGCQSFISGATYSNIIFTWEHSSKVLLRDSYFSKGKTLPAEIKTVITAKRLYRVAIIKAVLLYMVLAS